MVTMFGNPKQNVMGSSSDLDTQPFYQVLVLVACLLCVCICACSCALSLPTTMSIHSKAGFFYGSQVNALALHLPTTWS